jgi:hypothetical protein
MKLSKLKNDTNIYLSKFIENKAYLFILIL